jgi:DNA-binding NarL/FixJ family response regulator
LHRSRFHEPFEHDMANAIRILIADDQSKARRGLRALLGVWPDLEVIGEAADSATARELAEACRPDIVLMDVKMPASAPCGMPCDELGGIEATRWIKEYLPHTRVLMLTMDGGYRQEALAAGADGFMLKGESPESLVAEIRECVGENARRASGGAAAPPAGWQQRTVLARA